MHIALSIVAIAIVVLAVTALANWLKFSAPLLLIVAGVGASFIPAIDLPRLSPEIILLGFLPPLLYAAAIRTSVIDFRANRRSIASLSVLLVVGQGAFEESPTRALSSTRAFADLLERKGIRHDLDVWGHDSAHDWPWWQRQLAHHLPRFV